MYQGDHQQVERATDHQEALHLEEPNVRTVSHHKSTLDRSSSTCHGMHIGISLDGALPSCLAPIVLYSMLVHAPLLVAHRAFALATMLMLQSLQLQTSHFTCRFYLTNMQELPESSFVKCRRYVRLRVTVNTVVVICVQRFDNFTYKLLPGGALLVTHSFQVYSLAWSVLLAQCRGPNNPVLMV